MLDSVSLNTIERLLARRDEIDETQLPRVRGILMSPGLLHRARAHGISYIVYFLSLEYS